MSFFAVQAQRLFYRAISHGLLCVSQEIECMDKRIVEFYRTPERERVWPEFLLQVCDRANNCFIHRVENSINRIVDERRQSFTNS